MLLTNYSREELKDLMIEAIDEKKTTKENKEQEKMSQYEAAKFLGITPATLINWKKKGLIPYYQIDKSVFYIKSELLEALKKNPKLNK
ncbi:hypothetical protein ES708_14303 [subsurface metagenome]